MPALVGDPLHGHTSAANKVYQVRALATVLPGHRYE
jgi:hypothetical protein